VIIRKNERSNGRSRFGCVQCLPIFYPAICVEIIYWTTTIITEITTTMITVAKNKWDTSFRNLNKSIFKSDMFLNFKLFKKHVFFTLKRYMSFLHVSLKLLKNHVFFTWKRHIIFTCWFVRNLCSNEKCSLNYSLLWGMTIVYVNVANIYIILFILEDHNLCRLLIICVCY
jgi:hypothetical protein